MGIKIDPGKSVTLDFDAARGAVSSDVQTALDAAAKIALKRIQDAWYGIAPGTPRDHADGSPTQSVGLSGAAWHIVSADFSGGHAQVEIANSLDYSQYVHPSGPPGNPNHGTEGFGTSGDYGESAGNAEAQFEDSMMELESALEQIVLDVLADL